MAFYSQCLLLDGTLREDAVLRDDGVFILLALSDNPDTQAYEQWLAAGNTPGAPVSTARPPRTFLDFIALFTPVEQVAIFGSADIKVKQFTFMAAGSPQIDLDNEQVIGGVDYLESVNLIKAGRAAEILAGKTPS